MFDGYLLKVSVIVLPYSAETLAAFSASRLSV
jgi:hypothetical protein